MPTQDGLVFDPLREGIYKHVTTGDQIEHGRWMRAHAEGGYVGTCRACGGHLRPTQPYEQGTVTWYEAQCVSCGKTVAAPANRSDQGGRLLRRSSRHTEMPGGWWEHRDQALKQREGK